MYLGILCNVSMDICIDGCTNVKRVWLWLISIDEEGETCRREDDCMDIGTDGMGVDGSISVCTFAYMYDFV